MHGKLTFPPASILYDQTVRFSDTEVAESLIRLDVDQAVVGFSSENLISFLVQHPLTICNQNSGFSFLRSDFLWFWLIDLLVGFIDDRW